jgi:hypothetical protein
MGVGSPDFTGVTLTPAPATVYDDTYQQFHAIAHYSDGTTSVLQWSECSFASSDKTVADFTHNIAFWGRAFAANPGTTTITVGTPPSRSPTPTGSSTPPTPRARTTDRSGRCCTPSYAGRTRSPGYGRNGSAGTSRNTVTTFTPPNRSTN